MIIPTGSQERHSALSAMTAFLLLQDEGYRINPW